jgi:hypothetical protein
MWTIFQQLAADELDAAKRPGVVAPKPTINEINIKNLVELAMMAKHNGVVPSTNSASLIIVREAMTKVSHLIQPLDLDPSHGMPRTVAEAFEYYGFKTKKGTSKNDLKSRVVNLVEMALWWSIHAALDPSRRFHVDFAVS